MKLADAMRDDFRFAHVNNADILAASGLEGKIVLQRPRAMKNKFEEGDIEYSQEKYTGKNDIICGYLFVIIFQSEF